VAEAAGVSGGRNRTWRLRVSCLLIALLVVPMGCGDDDDEEETDGPDGGTDVPISTEGTDVPITTEATDVPVTTEATGPTVAFGFTAAQLAEIESIAKSNPDDIARDVNLLGSNPLGPAQVSPDEVVNVAISLCQWSFDPEVTLNWFRQRASRLSVVLIGPAERLLNYATLRCETRFPSNEETQRYRRGVLNGLAPHGAFGPLPTIQPNPGSIEFELCEALNSSTGGRAAEAVVGGMIQAASRKFDSEVVATFIVQVAGSSCSKWLPPAFDALRRVVG
jgi:hypothetical protein